ncbi:MAG TPA: hypothetical protein VGI05_12625 [Streptosporangiaceae bacterium]
MRILASPAASQVVPGVLGFLVVAAMGLALYFLLRSMNKHLRKVMREPRWREEAGGQEPGDGGDDGDGPQDQSEPDYSRNGSGQA